LAFAGVGKSGELIDSQRSHNLLATQNVLIGNLSCLGPGRWQWAYPENGPFVFVDIITNNILYITSSQTKIETKK